MGALPGRRLLTTPDHLPSGGRGWPPPSPLFDVEHYRWRTERHATSRLVTRPTLVLGSTQRAEVVDRDRAEVRGIDVVRRRGGGGSVLLHPGDHLWVDAWIPRADPLWRDDVSRAAGPVGAWWRAALIGAGVAPGALEVHRGRAVPGDWGRLVCFAGRGPGEVFHGPRKVIGLSQWRSRQGALFSGCAYLRWEPGPLAELLRVDRPVSPALGRELAPLAAGLGDLVPPLTDLAALGSALLTSFPGWGSDGTLPPS